MIEFHVISIATIIAVIIGGLGMGAYLACATKCGYLPSLVTLLVLGWSFLLPLSLTQIITTDGVDLGRMLERMALWALFAIHARVGARMWRRHNAGERLFRWL